MGQVVCVMTLIISGCRLCGIPGPDDATPPRYAIVIPQRCNTRYRSGISNVDG